MKCVIRKLRKNDIISRYLVPETRKIWIKEPGIESIGGLSTKWNQKSFIIPLREILYLEGSDVIFQITKGRKNEVFFIPVLSTISENCQWPVFPAFVLPFRIKREVDRSSRIASLPARTGLLPRLSKPVQRSRFLFFETTKRYPNRGKY